MLVEDLVKMMAGQTVELKVGKKAFLLVDSSVDKWVVEMVLLLVAQSVALMVGESDDEMVALMADLMAD
jgi:hypothetical protein